MGRDYRVGLDDLLHHVFSPSVSTEVLCMMKAPAAFTNRVMTSSTAAAYISRLTSLGPASGNAFASMAARVLAGENNEMLITLWFPNSIASAMVSPSARPNASTTPPKCHVTPRER